MDHKTHEIRTLLVEASADGPDPSAELRLLTAVRRRTRRRRVLVPSVATLAVTAAATVAAVATSDVVATPSAQARMNAAITRTSNIGGYRVHAVVNYPGGTDIMDGVFDAAHGNSRVVTQDGHEVRQIGSQTYDNAVFGPAPSRNESRLLQEMRSHGKRWLALPKVEIPRSRTLAPHPFLYLTMHDPQRALEALRSAAGVRDEGRVSGPGWTGHRYSFSLVRPGKSETGTGTVDVDQQDRIRRLTLVDHVDASGKKSGGHSGDYHDVTDFSDFGLRVNVTAPPADQVYRVPGPR
ncbi:hypothetical protein GCM10029978_041100 [Actinoallomurus acanthiterrae]